MRSCSRLRPVRAYALGHFSTVLRHTNGSSGQKSKCKLRIRGLLVRKPGRKLNGPGWHDRNRATPHYLRNSFETFAKMLPEPCRSLQLCRSTRLTVASEETAAESRNLARDIFDARVFDRFSFLGNSRRGIASLLHDAIRSMALIASRKLNSMISSCPSTLRAKKFGGDLGTFTNPNYIICICNCLVHYSPMRAVKSFRFALPERNCSVGIDICQFR